jgi:hypothetical protein
MMNFLFWAVLFVGVFNIASSLIVQAKGIWSSFVFKVIPFFAGLACILYVVVTLLQGGM